MDIFKKELWYTYTEERFKWFKLNLDQVLEIIELNKKGEKSISLEEYESEIAITPKVSFENVVGQDSLTRFDAPKRSKRRRNNRNKKRKPVGASTQQKGKKQAAQQTKGKNAQKGKPNHKRRNNNSNENTKSKK